MPGPEERLRDLGLSLPAPPAALAHEVMDGASDLWPGSPPVRKLARTPTGRASWPSIA